MPAEALQNDMVYIDSPSAGPLSAADAVRIRHVRYAWSDANKRVFNSVIADFTVLNFLILTESTAIAIFLMNPARLAHYSSIVILFVIFATTTFNTTTDLLVGYALYKRANPYLSRQKARAPFFCAAISILPVYISNIGFALELAVLTADITMLHIALTFIASLAILHAGIGFGLWHYILMLMPRS